jgi:hypothetical protein
MKYTLTLAKEDGEVLAIEEYDDEHDPNQFRVTVVLKPGLIE